MADYKNEVIKSCVSTLKSLLMDLAYGDTSEEDFETIVAFNETLKILEDEFAAIERDRDRQKEQASKLRKMFGNQFSAECDAAGIE